MAVWKTNLYLRADGTWLHEGTPVTHERMAALLHRSITAGPDGAPVVSTGRDAGTFDYEDTPLRVLAAVPADDGIHIRLSNERDELLDPATVRVHANGSWTCRGAQGLEARFTRSAQLALMDAVDASDDGTYTLKAAGRAHPLNSAQ